MAGSSASTNRSAIAPDLITHDTREAISTRAYQLWEESGRVHGQHEEHWRRAEEEIAGRPSPEPMTDDLLAADGRHRDGISDHPSQDQSPDLDRQIAIAER